MSYRVALLEIIDRMKHDKNANPKWRNKLISKLEEVEALLPKLDSREMTKAELESLERGNYQPGRVADLPKNTGRVNGCSCDPGSKLREVNCAVHGL